MNSKKIKNIFSTNSDTHNEVMKSRKTNVAMARWGFSWLRFRGAMVLLLLFVFCAQAKITGLPPYKTIDIPFAEFGSHFDLVVDEDNVLYIASAKGVKIFDGIQWQLVQNANHSSIRRLFYFQQRVYVGGSGNIGYIEKNKFGQYQYTDITTDSYQQQFESVWQILLCDNVIYFQDIHDVLSYDLNSKKTYKWHFAAKLGSMFCSNGQITLQNRSTGLVELKNQKWQDSPIHLQKNDLIYSFTPLANKEEIFILSDIEQWRVIEDQQVKTLSHSSELPHILNYVSVAAIEGDDFVLGSNNGLLTFVNTKSNYSETFQLSNEWLAKIIYQDNQLIILTEFKVYYLEWPSPFRFFSQESGVSSDIHHMQNWNDKFYIASSSGVYLEDQGQKIYQHKLFKRLNWTNREAWSLLPLSETRLLLAESHKLYVIDNQQNASPSAISSMIYPRELYASKYNSKLSYVVTEYGLYCLFDEQSGWNLKKLYSQRPLSLSETKAGKLLLTFNNPQGVELTFNPDSGLLLKESQVKIDNKKNLFSPQTKTTALVVINHQVYSYANQVLQQVDLFGLATALENEAVLSIKQDSKGHFYGHTFTKFFISNNKQWQVINLKPYLQSIINSTKEIGNEIKIASYGKIITYIQQDKISTPKIKHYKLNLNSVSVSKQGKKTPLALTPEQTFTCTQGDCSINFSFFLNDVVNHAKHHYRYRLLGLDDEWSEYFKDTHITFSKLPAGNYSFEVQAQDLNESSYATVPYKFIILPKWYLSNAAKVMWLSFTLLALYFLFKQVIKWREKIHEIQKAELKEIIQKKTIALEQANEELTKIAHSDGLTGLSNRLFLDEYINKLVAGNVQKLAVIMLDMDFFKHYNDSNGHLAGDELLKQLAQHLKQTFQLENNIIVRYGGEEFLVIIPNCLSKLAKEKAEILRQLIENKEKKTSVSIGIATQSKGEEITTLKDVYKLINQADKALYTAKETGRNKIVMA